jgi:hypothetical protein
MHATEIYVGLVLAAMFVVGIVLIVQWKRERSRTREHWTR